MIAEACRSGDGTRRAGPSLSPSRAGDFLTCPLLYRFRVIDRLPEPPSPAAARGTLVHAVLERLFDSPPAQRTPPAAHSLVQPEWSRLLEAEPELASLFEGEEEQRAAWLAEVAACSTGTSPWRTRGGSSPRTGNCASRPSCPPACGCVATSTGSTWRPGGEMRIVDYKTGGSPPEEFEARALFQMRFYALTLWRAQGRVPKLLQLIYLGNGEIVRYEPDEADLLATERKVVALWQAIERARVQPRLAPPAGPDL